MHLRLWKFSLVSALSLLVLTAAILWVYAYFPVTYFNLIPDYGVDPYLVLAVMKAESGFRPKAMSSRGAVGLMQILPETASYVCELYGFEEADLTDEAYNVKVGTAYLSYLFGKFEERTTVLAAYNAGEGNVSAWLRNEEYSKDGKTLDYIPFTETRSYTKKINFQYKIYGFLYQNV